MGKQLADKSKFEQEYKAIILVADSYSQEVTSQLNKLLQEGGVTLGFPIQSRVKTWESLVEKIDRGIVIAKSVKDVQDLVGLRVVLLFRSDVNKVSDIIARNFKVIRKYDTRERLNEDQLRLSSGGIREKPRR